MLFPARAGMIPRWGWLGQPLSSVPRTRGDDPAAEVNAQINRQVETLPFLPTDQVMKLKRWVRDSHIRRSDTLVEAVRDCDSSFMNTPLADITRQCCSAFLRNSVEHQGESEASIRRVIDDNLPTLDESIPDLKSARARLLQVSHCSLATPDAKREGELVKWFRDNWDYDGKTKRKVYDGNGPVHYDRRAMMNSPIFEVRNSNMSSEAQEYATGNHQTPERLFHATTYAATAGILGKTGGWKVDGSTSRIGEALGHGAYFGRKGGKSAPYCGDCGYAYMKPKGQTENNANGIYIMADVIKGTWRDYREDDSSRFNDYEIVIRNNKCINPRYIVDISARALGVNLKQDADGSYSDFNGKKAKWDSNGMILPTTTKKKGK